MKKQILAILFIIFFLNIISAVPPVTQVQQFTQGYIIEIPQDNVLKVNENYQFEFHVFNISDGVPRISDIVCNFYIYDPLGNHLYGGSDSSADSDFAYAFNVSGGNFTKADIYYYHVHCNDSYLGGYTSSSLQITNNGEEVTTAKGIFQLGLIFILTLFFILSVFGIFHFENYISKFTMYWVTHLFGIALTFVLWTTANSFLTDAPFLISFFHTLFWILLIAVFPMMILSMVYVLYIHTMNDHIKKLIEGGVEPEEAFKIAKENRKKKW